MAEISRRSMLRIAGATGLATGLGRIALPRDLTQQGATPPMSSTEQEAVASAIGKKGSYNEAQATYVVPLPRNDLKILIKGDPVPISFGFGGWVAVKKQLNGRGAVLMSDTVLLQEEVNPLIDAVQASGLQVGAIHNHFFYEEPRIFYMHVHGMGGVERLAQQYARAIHDSKLSPANQTAPAGGGSKAADLFDLAALDRIVGVAGTPNGATTKYVVGRNDLRCICMGAHITAAIGLNTWASFAGNRDTAHIAGDVAMLDYEVNPVIHALRAHNLEVVALHHHMLGENPRIVFLHYYGTGKADDLAKGFRAALDELGKPAPMHDM